MAGIWADDSGTLREIKDVIVRQSASNVEIDRVYRVRVVESPPGVFTQEYDLLWDRADYEAPTVSVPGVGIGKGPELLGPSTHTVDWTTSSTSPQQSYNVRVRWYVDTGFGASLDATDEVNQSVGAVSRTYNVSDDVYAVVDYTNAAGDGPDTTTPTI